MSINADSGVAVIGAAGFLGRELLRHTADLGLHATAVVRGGPELLADIAPEVVLTSETTRQFDTVINLAYPTSGHPKAYARMTQDIVDRAVSMVKPDGRIIHVSTLAVFGGAVDLPVVLGPAPQGRDTPYVDSKRQAEGGLVERQQRGDFALDIVRLGNLVGPASPGWGAGLVARLAVGRPAAVTGAPGWSNATDVRNVASYLTHLHLSPPPRSAARYHHVAEFFQASWLSWLEPLAGCLGVPVVYAPLRDTELPFGLRAEMGEILGSSKPRKLYAAAAEETVAGSLVRSVMGRLPESMFRRAKGPEVISPALRPVSRDEQRFLRIIAGLHQFPLGVEDGWAPAVSHQESVRDMLTWLERN